MDHLGVLARREISCLVVSLCRDTIPNVSFASYIQLTGVERRTWWSIERDFGGNEMGNIALGLYVLIACGGEYCTCQRILDDQVLRGAGRSRPRRRHRSASAGAYPSICETSPIVPLNTAVGEPVPFTFAAILSPEYILSPPNEFESDIGQYV